MNINYLWTLLALAAFLGSAFTSDKGKTNSIHTKKIFKAQHTIGGKGFDAANAIFPTDDGNYIVAGRSNSYSKGDMNMNIVKVSSAGSVIWNRNYGGDESEEAYAGTLASDGGFVFAGYSDSFGAGPDLKDIWIVKTDASGKKLWDKTYGTKESIDEAKDIIRTEDGGYLILANTLPLVTARTNVLVIKIDKTGKVVWQQKYGGDKSDEASQIAKTEAGYVIVGSTESKGKGKWDIWLFAIDKDGKKLWDNTLGGGDNEMGNAVEVMTDGSMIIGGYSYTYAEGSHDAWIVKLKKDGTKEWSKNVGGLSTDEFFDITLTTENEIVIAGYTDVYEPDEYYNNISPLGNNVLLVKYNDKGEEMWQRSIGGNKAQRAQGIVSIGGSGFLMAGYTDEADEEKSTDMLVMKVNASGQ